MILAPVVSYIVVAAFVVYRRGEYILNVNRSSKGIAVEQNCENMIQSYGGACCALAGGRVQLIGNYADRFGEIRILPVFNGLEVTQAKVRGLEQRWEYSSFSLADG